MEIIPEGRPPKYPWRKVEVGENFIIEKIGSYSGIANRRYAPKQFKQNKTTIGILITRIL